MIKKLRLLFGMGILLLGISCGDYVQAKEITEKSSLESALADEKTKLFIDNNTETLNRIRKEYDQLQVMVEGTGEIPYLAYKGEEQCGVYPQLIQFISSITKIPCIVKDSEESLEDNYSGTKKKEVDLIFGVTLPEAIASSEQTITQLNSEGMQLYKLSGAIFQNPLIVAVPREENYTKEQLSYAFWGAEMEYDSTIVGTMLADHTIEYNTYSEMKEAFERNEIEGMFIPESKLDYEILIENEPYHGLDFTEVKANEYFLDLSSSNLLSETISEIAVLYDQLYTKYFQSDNDWMKQKSSPDMRYLRKGLEIVGSIMTGVIIAVILFVIGMKQHTKRQFEKMLLQIPKNDSKWEDVLFVNLRNKKIQSKFGFSFYGLAGRSRKKKLKLDEMTDRIGFDFTKYYEYIMSRHKTEFTHEFGLYIQGVQYHYVETGIVCGKKVASRIYRK